MIFIIFCLSYKSFLCRVSPVRLAKEGGGSHREVPEVEEGGRMEYWGPSERAGEQFTSDNKYYKNFRG